MLLRTPRLIDQTAFMHRVRDLNDKARSAYWELSLHYWERGRLPNVDRDLAAVCKLPVVSFRNLRIQIGWAFDGTDGEGRWRDYDLEAERDDAIRALGLDPAAFREPAPVSAPAGGAEESRSPKSLAGSLNARKRWACVAAERASRDADGIGSTSAAVPNAMPTAVPNGAAGMVDGIAVAQPGVAVASSEKKKTLSIQFLLHHQWPRRPARPMPIRIRHAMPSHRPRAHRMPPEPRCPARPAHSTSRRSSRSMA